MQRLNVLKTYKLYIGGKFPRTESGRTMTAIHSSTKEHLAHYCHASRKDLRDAAVAARSALPGWCGVTAYLRSQILYRAAEMIESRSSSISTELRDQTGMSKSDSDTEVSLSVDRLVHFAGWCDKYSQVFGSVNPVATSHFNFTTPEPTGVVGVLAPDQPGLLGLVTLIGQCILSGNTVVAISSETVPLPCLSFAEALATSDLPGGVVNLLTGKRDELAPWMASHMDINAIVDGSGDSTVHETLQSGTADNLKRVYDHSLGEPGDWKSDSAIDPYRILDTVEWKSAWHPIGV